MSVRRIARALAAAGVLAWCAPASAQHVEAVSAQFDAFGPGLVDVLPGETVQWTNVSPRTHSVTSDSGAFASDALVPAATFSVRFDDVGAFPYHCTIHAGMVGEVDVRRVILGGLPTAVVPAGDRVEMTGRAADSSRPVRIERSLDGTTFAPVAQTIPHADGTWSVNVTAEASADYRAASGAEVSQTRRLAVSDRRVLLRATRTGVVVTVTPSLPYGHVLLQRDERERFGWWPVARARLDYVSTATFTVRGPGRVRALLVDRDGWTALATSPPVMLRPRARSAR
jgi:plastocyanin